MAAPRINRFPAVGVMSRVLTRSVKKVTATRNGVLPRMEPRRKSRNRMWEAPATMLIMENGRHGEQVGEGHGDHASPGQGFAQAVQFAPGQAADEVAPQDAAHEIVGRAACQDSGQGAEVSQDRVEDHGHAADEQGDGKHEQGPQPRTR